MAFNIRDSVTRIQHTALDTEKLLSPLYKLKKKKTVKWMYILEKMNSAVMEVGLFISEESEILI